MNTVDLRKANLRIVSLIPSATEIVAALGYADCLVGRSHECDFPTSVKSLPVCTEPKFDPVGSSGQIHKRVSELLSSALSVYSVNVEVLRDLRPTHIITQAQCEVCAVSLSEVEQAVNNLFEDNWLEDNLLEKSEGEVEEAIAEDTIEIVSLQPERLADVWSDILRVARAIDNSTESVAKAQRLVESLQAKLPLVECAADERQISVVCIEWTEPLMAAGNWVPELVRLAGGRACFGKAGKHSGWISWEDLLAADPEKIVVMPCGYDLAQTRRATEEMSNCDEWKRLSAVKTGQVYLVDGNQYFNRPGPRLVESGEILTEIIQERAANNNRESVGWEVF